MRKAFRYRLEPTTEQENKLRQFAGARRFIWNWALRQRQEYYCKTGKTLPLKELSARLTVLKNEPETAWLRQMDSQLLQQVLTDLYRAFSNYFERRARYPRLKSRKRDRARFRIPQRVRVVGHVVQKAQGRAGPPAALSTGAGPDQERDVHAERRGALVRRPRGGDTHARAPLAPA
jgi:putative transposase